MELMVIGCDGSYPSANGACSGYLVKHGDAAILLDCGSGVLSKLMALMDPTKLKAIIITHWHNDHANDLLVLQYYLLIHQKILTVYAPLNDNPLKNLCEGKELDIRDIREVPNFGEIEIEVTPAAHSLPAYAVKLSCDGKSIVYTGDTNRWENLVPFCRDTDLLICDATFLKEQWHEDLPHLTAQQAAFLGKESGAKQLLLTHFQPGSDGYSLLSQAREIVQSSEAAKAGEWYSV